MQSSRCCFLLLPLSLSLWQPAADNGKEGSFGATATMAGQITLASSTRSYSINSCRCSSFFCFLSFLFALGRRPGARRPALQHYTGASDLLQSAPVCPLMQRHVGAGLPGSSMQRPWPLQWALAQAVFSATVCLTMGPKGD